MKSKIKTGFTSYGDAVLYVFASAVYSSVFNNENFPATQALMPNLSAAVSDYNLALDNAKGLGKVLVEIKNTKKAELIAQLQLVGYSVAFEANGDRQKLLSSSFELQKQSAPTVLEYPTGTELMDGNIAGKLKMAVTGGKSFRVLNYQITPDPITADSVWTSAPSTRRQYTFENLESDKRYWACVQIIGSNGQEYISSPVSRVAQ